MVFTPFLISSTRISPPKILVACFIILLVVFEVTTFASFSRSQILRPVETLIRSNQSITNRLVSTSFGLMSNAQVPTIDQLTIGHWEPRSTAYKHRKEFIRGHEERSTLECDGDPARLPEVASFIFVPDAQKSGTYRRWEWDEELVIRWLLNMPNGIFFVGDSLSNQMATTLRTLLGAGDLVIQSEMKVATLMTKKTLSLWRVLHLNPEHPLYAHLLEQNEYTLGRLGRPLAHSVRSHHLASNFDLSRWVPSLHQDAVNNRVGYSYGSDLDWLSMITETLEKYYKDKGESEFVLPSPTVLMLSSGPHWGSRRFSKVSDATQSEAMLEGYSYMVDHVLGSLPSTPNLRVVVRGGPNPPDSCSQDLGQIPSSLNTLEYKHSLPPTRYNYQLFPLFDQLWRNAIPKINSDTRIEFFDSMRVMQIRTDAGKSPASGDCLHFCIPALQELVRLITQHLMQS